MNLPGTSRRSRSAPTYLSATLGKGLDLLIHVLNDGGRTGLSEIAVSKGLSEPTVHRLALTLEHKGFLKRTAKGFYGPGLALIRLAELCAAEHQLAFALRHSLARLARKFSAFAHAGILEDGMVTYLIKESGDDSLLFTTEQMQLEAYCSAIGKILLASLPIEELEAYLASGPFIKLTSNTITDPDQLRREIEVVRKSGVAFDRFEVRSDLYCIGVPLLVEGAVKGAVSLSFLGQVPDAATEKAALRSLRRAGLGERKPVIV